MKIHSVVGLVTNSSTSIFTFATGVEDAKAFIKMIMDFVARAGSVDELEIWIEPYSDVIEFGLENGYFDRFKQDFEIAVLFENGCLLRNKQGEFKCLVIDKFFDGDRKKYADWLMSQDWVKEMIDDWEYPLETRYVVRVGDQVIYDFLDIEKIYSQWGIYNG